MKVELLRPVNHDNQDYKAGDVLDDLTDEQAKALIEVGSAKAYKAGKPGSQAGAEAQATSVLNEAKAKAEQIVADAEEAAEQIKAKAEEESAATKAQAEEDAAKVRADAEANTTTQQTSDAQGGQENLKAVPKKVSK